MLENRSITGGDGGLEPFPADWAQDGVHPRQAVSSLQGMLKNPLKRISGFRSCSPPFDINIKMYCLIFKPPWGCISQATLYVHICPHSYSYWDIKFHLFIIFILFDIYVKCCHNEHTDSWVKARNVFNEATVTSDHQILTFKFLRYRICENGTNRQTGNNAAFLQSATSSRVVATFDYMLPWLVNQKNVNCQLI